MAVAGSDESRALITKATSPIKKQKQLVIAPGKFNNAHGIIAIVFSIIIFYFSPTHPYDHDLSGNLTLGPV